MWNMCLSVYKQSKLPHEPFVERPQHPEEKIIPYSVENELVGFLSYIPLSDKVAFLWCLYVLPEYQMKGIGSNLIDKLKEQYKFIMVPTDDRHTTAINLYKKKGLFINTVSTDTIGKEA